MSEQSSVLRAINPPTLAPPPGYAQVVEVRPGRLVFVAGQAAYDRTGTVVGKSDFAAQAAQVFDNLATALSAAGCSAADLVKLTVYVRDMRDLAAYRQARDRFFASAQPRAAPAVTLVEVSRLFDDKLLIEIEAIAAAP